MSMHPAAIASIAETNLRDHFAGLAMAEWLRASLDCMNVNVETIPEEAYRIADAMLEFRTRAKDSGTMPAAKD